MKTVYGLRMIDLEDILLRTGRPAAICDYLAKTVRGGNEVYNDYPEVLKIDTSLMGNVPIFNTLKPFVMWFVPLDLVEERIIMERAVSSFEDAKNTLITSNRVGYIDKLIDRREARYATIASKYKGEGDVLEALACMFLFDDGKFIDVYTAIPGEILDGVLLKEQIYKCHNCDKEIKAIGTSDSEYIPDMRYRVARNEIEYFCTACVNHLSLHHLKHVGE